MPHISPDGLIAMNAGSYQWRGVWNNLGPDVAVGGWYKRNELCFVRYYHVFTINLDTLVEKDWGPHQGNGLYAGGGVWAVKGPYYDSWGPNPGWDQTNWIPFAVDSLTGDIAVQLPDWTFAVYRGNSDPNLATLTPLFYGIPVVGYQASFFNGVLTVYKEGGWYHWSRAAGLTYTGSIAIKYVGPGAQCCHGANLGGTSNYGRVVWLDWDPEHAIVIGWVINYNDTIYRAAQNSNIIEVIGSKGAGELPGEQQVFTIDLAAKTLDGKPYQVVDITRDSVIPIDPVPPIIPIPPVPPIEVDMQLPGTMASRFNHPAINYPGRWLYECADGQYLAVDDVGQVYLWDPGVADPNSTAHTSFERNGDIYIAPRNFLFYRGNVDLGQ